MTELVEHVHAALIRLGRRGEDQRFGLEFEYPVASVNKTAVDPAVAYALMEELMTLDGATVRARDARGRVIAVECRGDYLAYEYSTHSFELSLAPAGELLSLDARYRELIGRVHRWLRERGHMLVGMGLHPHRAQVEATPLDYLHYEMLGGFMARYASPDPAYHDPNFFGLINSSQIHFDAHEDDVAGIFALFNRLDPILALLFANSVAVDGEGAPESAWLCNRDRYYAANRSATIAGNVGPWARGFVDAASVCAATLECAAWFRASPGLIECFEPIRLKDLFACERVETEVLDETLARRAGHFRPDPSYLHSSFKSFKHVTLTRHRTVELRGICAQPLREGMVPAAFTLGCLARAEEIGELLAALGPDEGIPARRRAVAAGEAHGIAPELVEQILACATAGLRDRGHGEEQLLAPLLLRGASSPAAAIQLALRGGASWDQLVETHAQA